METIVTPTDPSLLIPTIERLTTLISSYTSRPGRVNESNTIRALITPMIDALGWNVMDLDEVQSEYRHTSGDNPVDFALFLDGAPSLFIEAKALDQKLDDRKWIVQTLNYANICNVEWAVLTNGAEWRVYNVHARAEAEDKIFYTVHLDGPDSTETARRLSMLSKANMAPKRALDRLWREASVDRAMRGVIETLPDNRAAVRAMAKASNGLSEKDVRDALRRLGLRADWRDDDDLFPIHAGDQDKTPLASVDAPGPAAAENSGLETNLSDVPTPRPKTTRMRMVDLLAAGAISQGQKIRIRSHPDHVAEIVDGKTCEYRGKRMSYNEWGCAATGWKAIQIYVRAETMDGVLLDDLRNRIEEQSTPS